MALPLRVEDLAYRYPQNDRGVMTISLDVSPGDTWLVMGPSGCGKSTLARCLTGLIPHLYQGQMEGRVFLDGLDTSQTPLWQLTQKAGLVMQNPAAQMLASTVEGEIVFGLENLGLPRDEIQARLEEVLAQFDLLALRERSPLTLSGGEQQKVALAAMIARRPAVLVLDEPFSMLDSTASFELLAYLRLCAERGTALVICEHRHGVVRSLPAIRKRLPAFEQPSDASPFQGMRGCLASLTTANPFTLEIEHLNVSLEGHQVLRDLSFRVSGGQILAIVGRNGVGKTTLLRALVGLQHYTGKIHVAGRRPELALVFQNPDVQLFNASVREEILYKVSDPDLDYYHWLLQVLGLDHYEDSPPLLLSEGEKKRVALATALMRKPRHGVLFDEPSLGQDTVHKARLMVLARALADAGHVVVMTTHDLPLAARADRMMLLGPEGFVADGPPSQVLHDGRAWARLGLHVPEWIEESPL